MRIAIDAVATPPTGAGFTRIKELARSAGLHDGDDEYLFVVRPEVMEALAPLRGQADYIALPRQCGSMAARVAWQQLVLPSVVSRWQPDVVFGPFNVTATKWPARRPALAVMVSNLAPYSEIMWNLCPASRKPRELVLKVLTTRTIRHSDRVFLQSQHARELIGADLLAGKAVVVTHRPPAAIDHDAAPPAASGRYVLVVAELHSHKGVETVIDALALLGGQSGISLRVCGRVADPRYVASLKRRVAARGLERQVEFLGNRSHDEVLQLMRGAVAVVASSRFENLSRIPTEGMAAGVPVLAADLPSYREACGCAARYYKVDRADELARHIAALASDNTQREGLIACGQARLDQLRNDSGNRDLFEELRILAQMR